MKNSGVGARLLVLSLLVLATCAMPASARQPQAGKATPAGQAGPMPGLVTEIHHLVDLLAQSGNMQKGSQNHVYQALHQLLLAMQQGNLDATGVAQGTKGKGQSNGRTAKGKAAAMKGGKKSASKGGKFAGGGAGKATSGKSRAGGATVNSFQMVQRLQLTQPVAQAARAQPRNGKHASAAAVKAGKARKK